MALKIIHTKNLRWIDIVNPGEDEIAYLKSNFTFHPLDYEDIVNPSEHSKVESRDGYHFIVLIFPAYDREAGEILPAEVDFFVGPGFVVTVHDGRMYTMSSAIAGVSRDASMRAAWMNRTPGSLLYHILELLFKRSFPILDHMSKDMGAIEKNIFRKIDMRMLREIAQMKRNVIDVRRIMKTHHMILKRLMAAKEPYMFFTANKEYYASLLEHSENIWDILAIQKETVEALQDANQAMATNVLNQITRTFTIISGIFFPATLIIFVFDINAGGNPLRSNPNGFWLVLAIAGLTSAIMIAFFRSRRWL